MLMRLINPSYLIGCGMDPQPIRNLSGSASLLWLHVAFLKILVGEKSGFYDN